MAWTKEEAARFSEMVKKAAKEAAEEVVPEIVEKAVKDEMQREFRNFYIPPEEHYRAHEFMSKLEKLVDSVADTTLKTLVQAVIKGLVAMVLLGILTYIWVTK